MSSHISALRHEVLLLAFLILGWSPGLKLSESTEFPHFQLSDGDHITCVPIREQLSVSSLGDPLYQEPTATVKPSYGLKKTSTGSGDHSQIKPAGQLFHTEAGSCPEGMIPVRQSRGNVTSKVGDIKHLLKPTRAVHSTHGKTSPRKSTTASSLSNPEADFSDHEYGTAYKRQTFLENGYGGAGGTFNIWQPYVELSVEFSLSQLWIISGSFENHDLNTIEVGWQVYEAKYGDKLPHLFIYWTSDAYHETGCYNLQCPGFVQTSNKWVIGGSLDTISSTDGPQTELTAVIFLQSGFWWLALNDEIVGYWPTTLFSRLTTAADKVDWGGEIVNKEPDGRHTATDMGSGAFASAGLGKAAYIRRMHTVDLQNYLQNAPASNDASITDAGCYNILNFQTPSEWLGYLYVLGWTWLLICFLPY